MDAATGAAAAAAAAQIWQGYLQDGQEEAKLAYSKQQARQALERQAIQDEEEKRRYLWQLMQSRADRGVPQLPAQQL